MSVKEIAPNIRGLVANVKRWTVTIEEELADNNSLILTDDWLAEHYDDPNLFVTMIPLAYTPTTTTTTVPIGFFVGNTVTAGTSDANPYYGIVNRVNADDAPSTAAMYHRLSGNADTRRPRLYSDGRLVMKNGVCAGTYQITAWLM